MKANEWLIEVTICKHHQDENLLYDWRRAFDGHQRDRSDGARIFVYNMLKNGTKYKDMGQDYYETRYAQRTIDNLKRRAKQFGYELTLTNENQLVTENG